MASDYQIINRTIYEYFLERRKEFNNLNKKLESCSCFPCRKKIKLRLEELKSILQNEVCLSKGNLASTLKIKYKDLKDYPHLVDVQRKIGELKREIL